MAPSLIKISLISMFLLSLTATARALNASLSSYPHSSSSSSSLNTHESFLKSLCTSTPYPNTCFDTFKLSISIGINPNILNILLHSLETAISQIAKLADLFSSTIAGSSGIIETQKGSIQDCQELHQITLSALRKSLGRIKREADMNAYLSAALTNRATCMEGLNSATGPLKPILVESMTETYKYVSNSLALLSKPGTGGGLRRRLLGFPSWISRRERRLLQSSDEEYDPSAVQIKVAQDGSGNFTSVGDAISFAPNNSLDRIIIFVREGVYVENVEISKDKPNIVLLGDGSDVTVITGNRSVGDGWTTFRSATVAVSGEGFLARDISFENTAGPGEHQAVALRVNADLTAFYRCSMTGYQDTLYVHSFRQFYRECDIYGTVDFIFGNAAVIFQGCNLVARNPLPGQSIAVTAQSRDDEYEETGISIQNCSVLAADDLNTATTKSYLGRPWRNYSRTVYIKSYLGDLIDPAGWSEWSGDQGLDTLYYGEFENTGPGSGTLERVDWSGYHVMSYEDASNFTVTEFITGDEWLDSTSFPYDQGV